MNETPVLCKHGRLALLHCAACSVELAEENTVLRESLREITHYAEIYRSDWKSVHSSIAHPDYLAKLDAEIAKAKALVGAK